MKEASIEDLKAAGLPKKVAENLQYALKKINFKKGMTLNFIPHTFRKNVTI